jgi:DNA-binding beta-propeller fold protein YncE
MDGILARIREDERLKHRLIILLVLVLVVILMAFLLNRKVSQKQTIAGGSFSFLVSIYDLTNPMGVATDADENIYVSNTGKSEVIVYDKEGVRQRAIDDTVDEKGNPLRFYSPYGIAVDDDNDKLYVCDYNWRGVRVLTKSGEFLYNLPKNPTDIPLDPAVGFAPYGVAVGQDRIYVTSKDGIYVFDLDGNYKTRWGTRGNAAGQYDFPNGIAADRESGNIFVADTVNRRVVSLDREGKIRWMLGVPKKDENTSVFQLPRSVTVGSDGLVYVTDTFWHRVVVIDQDGNLVSMFGERGTQDGQFSFPEGLAVSVSNRLYVADRQNNRVQIWQLAEPMPGVKQADKTTWAEALTRQP